jgi:hypothetical protein
MYGTDDYTPEERFNEGKDLLTDAFYAMQDECDKLQNKLDDTEAALSRSDAALQTAYTQRAIAAIAFAHTVLSLGGTAGVGLDNRVDQPDSWRVVLYVDTPAGQLSWHIAPADQLMLAGLPQYAGTWDGLWNSADVNFYKEFARETTL